MCCDAILQCETEGYRKRSDSNRNCSFIEKGTKLDRGNFERYRGFAVVQYYNVRMKGIGTGAAGTGTVAVDRR
jgi:hypothetical protein